MAAHDFKGSSQGCAVHDQHLAHLALGYFVRLAKALARWRTEKPAGQAAERLFIELSEGPRPPAEAAAQAREHRRSAHGDIDVYTYNCEKSRHAASATEESIEVVARKLRLGGDLGPLLKSF
jgi:hypothetical protein